MKSTVISEALAAIQAATALDARYLPDVAKQLNAVYSAGEKNAAPVHVCAPLTSEEVTLLRDGFRSTPALRKAKSSRK